MAGIISKMAKKFIEWLKKNKWKVIAIISIALLIFVILRGIWWYNGYVALYDCYINHIENCQAIILD
jgi:hypothetical protein